MWRVGEKGSSESTIETPNGRTRLECARDPLELPFGGMKGPFPHTYGTGEQPELCFALSVFEFEPLGGENKGKIYHQVIFYCRSVVRKFCIHSEQDKDMEVCLSGTRLSDGA